ncbi:GIDE domain-containing protein [Marinobacterium sp. YM272]|uniref:GIDE domain-containing protein n=1 Tax=Marinobacterium sp. YM272 TaxID=3421654 RepID=UPI003D7F5207
MLLDLNIESHERLIGLIICIIGFLVCVFFAFRRFGHYRLIVDTPTALIRSAPQGYVEISGSVIAGEDGQLRSPLSGQPCVWYRIKVDRYERNSNNKGGRWRSVRRETSQAWFQIDDGTGICLVDPEGAMAATQHKKVWFGHTEMPGAALSTSSFQQYSARLVGSFASGRYRYTEELIFEHERLYTLGSFQSVGGGRERLDLKAATTDILRGWKSDQAALIGRFDADKDGKIDQQEWYEARKQALREAKLQQREMDKMPTMHVLGDPKEQGHPFVISTFDEERLLSRFRWQLGGFMACGLLAFWLGLELLLTTPV